jgi:hypothetical protein
MQAQEAIPGKICSCSIKQAFLCTYYSFCGAAVKKQKISNAMATQV